MPTRRRRAIRRLTITVLAFVAGLAVADRMMTARSVADEATASTAATTGPTGAPVASRPTIPSDAQAILDRVTAAYARRPVAVAGSFEQHFDVAGIVKDQTLAIRGLARDASTFRHEAGDALLIVGDGKSRHLYDPKGKRFNTVEFASADAAPGEDVRAILAVQNPAMGVALVGDAARAIVPDGASDVRRLAPATDGGQTFDRVAFEAGGVGTEIWVRSDGGAIDRATYDFKPMLERGGAAAVQRAEATIRYRSPAADDAAGAADDAQFAFAPPADAREATASADGDGTARVGENAPAPAFALKDLDGKEATLAGQQGHVVVLDFWATWCGPCRQSMPHLSAAAQAFADRGVRVFALNLQEEPDVIRAFLAENPIANVRTLLDSDGKVAASYGVEGIPHTVVIDKAGMVRKVIVGFNPESGGEGLKAAIGAALAR